MHNISLEHTHLLESNDYKTFKVCKLQLFLHENGRSLSDFATQPTYFVQKFSKIPEQSLRRPRRQRIIRLISQHYFITA